LTLRAFSNGLLLVAVLFLISGTTGDPDLWGHVRFGQDMVAARTVRVPDTYSFTTDRPWVNHEWLSEVAMAAAYDGLGAAGLNLFRIAIVLSVLALVWHAMAGVPDRRRILVASAGALGMLWRAYPIRPQLVSLLMFAILLRLIVLADDRRSFRPLLLIPFVMAVWVNAHGGWIVGVAILGLWTAMTAITASWRERIALAGVLAASLAATLVNPYGYGMWAFLGTTVGLERPMISDWQPLYRMPWNFWMPWIAAAGLVLAAATKIRSRVSVRLFAIAIVLGLLAVRVSRLDAFFAIGAMFFAARVLRDRAIWTFAAPLPVRRSPVLACCFAAVLATATFIALPRILTVPLAPGSVPDAQVAGYVRAQHLKGTVLIWFDWGQYAIWQFGPDLKVSMDGRRETVYSPQLVDAHMRFYFGEAGASRYADELRPDYVWIPAALPVVRELERSGWRAACEGPTSVLLTRRDLTAPCVSEPPLTPRLFPRL
jgi:hypothetical protein